MVENKDYFIDKWNAELESSNVLKKYKAQQFIKIISSAKPIREFDINLYFIIVEKLTVLDGKKINLTLLDGTEI